MRYRRKDGNKMGKGMFDVTINGEDYSYRAWTSYETIAKAFQKQSDPQIILVMVDGKLQELSKTLEKDCTLEFVTTAETTGYNTYNRTAVFMLLKAIYDVNGKGNVPEAILHHSLGNALYFTLRGVDFVAEQYLKDVEQRMRELSEEKVPIRKKNLRIEEGIELFRQCQMYDKERLMHYRRNSRVNVYSIEDFYDYFYGYMAPDTGYVRKFKLQLYDEGFVLVLPEKGNPDVLKPFHPQEKIFRIQKESQKWGERMHLDSVAELNDRITSEGVQNILQIQEAYHEAKIAEIAHQIRERGNVKFVMIAGPSSSGKTTFSYRLSIQLRAEGLNPHPIAVDNYFVDREKTPLDKFGERDYECLEAIDTKQFNQDMLSLLNGEEVELPEYNFVEGKREYKGNKLKLQEDDILVIEGIHCLNDAMSYALPKESKFKVYISALTQLNIDEHNRVPTTDGRLLRRMVRDARTRGISALETIARWPSVRRGEEKYIFPFQEDADVMFNSALVYELACLKIYAEPLLFGIMRNAPEYIEAKRLLKFLDYFVPVPEKDVPNNSILREFIGGSCFKV